MASDTVAFYMIHPHRSKEAFAALIDDWAGILVSDGYGVYQSWVASAQTCLAHLIRTARGLAERSTPTWPPVGRGPRGTATSLPYGHSPTDGRGVAGVVCPALPADRPVS